MQNPVEIRNEDSSSVRDFMAASRFLWWRLDVAVLFPVDVRSSPAWPLVGGRQQEISVVILPALAQAWAATAYRLALELRPRLPLAVVHADRAAPHRAARHAGDADRRERPTDPGLGGRDKTAKAWRRKLFQSSKPDQLRWFRRAGSFSVSWSWSLGTFWRKLCWQFIDVDEFLEVDLLGVGRRLEGEIVRGNVGAGLPVADLDAVLRALVDRRWT